MRIERQRSAAQNIAVALVIICMLMAVVSLGIYFYNQPDRLAQRELEKISKDYYEHYFYDKLKDTNVKNDSLKAIFEKYAEPGFGDVKLRQLLLYDNAKHGDSISYFDSAKFYCDTNETYVKFYPIEPYGRTDYRVEYHPACQSR